MGDVAAPVARRVGSVPGWLFAVALVVAAYTGFRLPDTWSATLATVSLTDGFHRRFLVGTVLHPLAGATGYNYWLFAAEGFLVLGALLAALAVAYLRTELAGRRLLIIAWLLLPTGGYLFHEVGYFDQLLYLLLFGALWSLHRNRPVLATFLMSASVLVHEIAILTVLPIFGMVLLSGHQLRRAVLLLAPPVLLNLLVLAVQPASAGAVQRLSEVLTNAHFPVYPEALALFERTQAQSWQLYSIKEGLLFLGPIAALVVAAFLLLRVTDAGLAVDGESRLAGPVGVGFACIAIGAPMLLAFAGFDFYRWAFMLVSNFVVVLWLHLGGTHRRDFGTVQLAVLCTVLLVVTHIPMGYFDGYVPRALEWSQFRSVIHGITDGTALRPPGS